MWKDYTFSGPCIAVCIEFGCKHSVAGTSQRFHTWWLNVKYFASMLIDIHHRGSRHYEKNLGDAWFLEQWLSLSGWLNPQLFGATFCCDLLLHECLRLSSIRLLWSPLEGLPVITGQIPPKQQLVMQKRDNNAQFACKSDLLFCCMDTQKQR